MKWLCEGAIKAGPRIKFRPPPAEYDYSIRWLLPDGKHLITTYYTDGEVVGILPRDKRR